MTDTVVDTTDYMGANQYFYYYADIVLIGFLYILAVLSGLFQIVSSSKSLIKTYKEMQQIYWKELKRNFDIVFFTLLFVYAIYFLSISMRLEVSR